MNQKDLIKYGLIALGAYLVWKYVQDQGGFEKMFGTGKSGETGKQIDWGSVLQPKKLSGSVVSPSGPLLSASPEKPATTALDTSGLIVSRDVNDSLAGVVKIHGAAVRLAIIQSDGRIFDNAGVEVSAQLANDGVDLSQLRAAFTQAGAGLGMFAPLNRSSVWLM